MAVEMARLGQVEALMKGSLHTDELMAAIVPSTTGLRTARRISHVFVMDVPTYPRLLFVTDAAVNIFPTLDDKVDIVQNAIDLARTLGIEKPKVAVLSALEMVTSKIESTLHAAALCKIPTAADHGRRDRRAARLRQRDLGSRREGEEDRLSGGREGGHPDRAGPGGRQHAGEAVAIPRGSGCGWHRSWGPRPHRAHEPGRQRAHPARIHGGHGAGRAREARARHPLKERTR
jgi:hypothetical protein